MGYSLLSKKNFSHKTNGNKGNNKQTKQQTQTSQNPKGRCNPYPTPCNRFCQLQNHKDSKQHKNRVNKVDFDLHWIFPFVFRDEKDGGCGRT
jgi:hypothetical protein